MKWIIFLFLTTYLVSIWSLEKKHLIIFQGKYSKNINKLGLINDDISKKVRSQYEENPYPRWRYGNIHKNHKLSLTNSINNEINFESIESDPKSSKKKERIF